MPDGIDLKRIIDLDPETTVTDDDYTIVDSTNGGAKKFAIGQALGEIKDDINELGVLLTAKDYPSNRRQAVFEVSFERGKTYQIELRDSSETVIFIRISSDKSLDVATIIEQFDVQDTSKTVSYTCESDEAKYLQIICSSGVTSFTCSVSVYLLSEGYKYLETEVESNTKAIESLNPVVLPDYYFAENYIQNKIATINGNTPLDGVTFAFITDLHFFSNQLKSLPLLQYIRANTSLDTIVSGGDYVQAYGGQADIDFAKEKVIKYAKTLYPDWLSVRGNHDFTIRTDASASTGITEDDRATYYAIVRVSADWRYEVVTPEHDIINTTYNIYKNYNWVATNEQAKVKIIGLCDYNTTKTSAYWGVSRFFTNAYAAYFCQMLNDCDGYTVVVVTHAPITDQLQGGASNRLTEVIEAYANRRTVTFGSYSYDFSQATGVIACALSGHWHADQNAVVNGVLHINTTCDALYQDDGYNRTAGTVSEQAFDVINLDTANKTIKMTRIGGGSDRNFTY